MERGDMCGVAWLERRETERLGGAVGRGREVGEEGSRDEEAR